MAEGAPLLREYVGKTCIEGSNPSGSAKKTFRINNLLQPGQFLGKSWVKKGAQGNYPQKG